MNSPVGPRVVIAGRERDYFSGTGYLGLQSHPTVLQAAIDCIQRYGLSTATSRGGYGEHPVYAALDHELRAFWETDGVLYFASGYLGATILCQGLQGEYERVFVDAWSHFSVFDAIRTTGKPVHTYPHLDPAGLQTLMERELQPGERPLVISDGVFPISGEIAPLPGLWQVVAPFQGWLVLDDAHAAGVLGPHGRGAAEFYGMQHERLVASATLSKGLGGYGGIVPGSSDLLARIDRSSRVYVAASPPPLVVAAAAAQALSIARQQPELREKLWENVRLARSGMQKLGWPLAETPVPILCLGTRPGVDLGQIKNQLFERDICIAHVRNYSSTPPGGALRIAISAAHTHEQIERLLFEIANAIAFQ